MVVLFVSKMSICLTLMRNLRLNMMLCNNISYVLYVLPIQSYEGCECVQRPLTRHVCFHGVVAVSKY
jgi:hypothetical protein